MSSAEEAKNEETQTPEPTEDASADEREKEPGQPNAQAAETPESSGEGSAEGGEEPLRPLDVYSVLRISVAQLSAVAWQMMGLQPDPFTKEVRKDNAQARVAIDATAALLEKLRPHLKGQEARDYETILTDLRLNFVKQCGESEAGD
jgi:hypothetical protein